MNDFELNWHSLRSKYRFGHNKEADDQTVTCMEENLMIRQQRDLKVEATTCISVAQRSCDYFWLETLSLNELIITHKSEKNKMCIMHQIQFSFQTRYRSIMFL